MSLGTHINFGHSRNRISYHQLKLAMRRYRFGPISGIDPESLSYTQVRFYRHPLRVIPCYPPRISPFIPTLFSIEAQICPEPLGLYIRMQDIILFDTWEDSKVVPESNPICIYKICFHTRLSSTMSDLDALKDGKDSHIDHICSRCNTVCVIEILQVETESNTESNTEPGYKIEPESKIALIMTRWVNLGPGLDHEDPLWRICVGWSSAPRPKQLPQSMMTKSPRLCYENQSPESFEELRTRNLSYLTKGRYRKGKPLVSLGQWLWYIPYKEPSKKGRGNLLWKLYGLKHAVGTSPISRYARNAHWRVECSMVNTQTLINLKLTSKYSPFWVRTCLQLLYEYRKFDVLLTPPSA